MKFLITGATGGLGKGVLSHLAKHVPGEDFAASSSRADAARQFEDDGIQFRHADYDDLDSLKKAFQDVEKLLFVSSSTFDNEKRTIQHGNVIAAAKTAGVRHVYYTSLAFGGYKTTSSVSLQTAHLATEALLEKSGLNYTSVREGIYAEAFPLYLDWFPSTQTVFLPADGPVAFASRSELAEATAMLMLKGTHDTSTMVLLTGPKAYTLTSLVHLLNKVTSRNIQVKRVSNEEFVREKTKPDGDVGGKGEAFFSSILSWYQGMAEGDCETVDPLMGELLGRAPMDAEEVIRRLLEGDRDYEWHQNSVKKA